MIDKLVSGITNDLLNFFKQYNINLAAQYTPELPGVLTYARNYLSSTLSASPVSNNGQLYQNKLLYKINTPKLAEFAPQNNIFSVMAGFENISQNYTIEKSNDGMTITKVRTLPIVNGQPTEDGNVLVRDVTLMQIPFEFCVITEDLNLIFAITSLFYQQICQLDMLDIELNLFNDGKNTTQCYFMNWDRDSLEVGYANFESNTTLNTLTFSLMLSGPIFSEFYTESSIVDTIPLTIQVTSQPVGTD